MTGGSVMSGSVTDEAGDAPRGGAAIGVVLIETEVCGNEVGERTHSFAVSSSPAIVRVERGGQRQHALGGLGCVEVSA